MVHAFSATPRGVDFLACHWLDTRPKLALFSTVWGCLAFLGLPSHFPRLFLPFWGCFGLFRVFLPWKKNRPRESKWPTKKKNNKNRYPFEGSRIGHFLGPRSASVVCRAAAMCRALGAPSGFLFFARVFGFCLIFLFFGFCLVFPRFWLIFSFLWDVVFFLRETQQVLMREAQLCFPKKKKYSCASAKREGKHRCASQKRKNHNRAFRKRKSAAYASARSVLPSPKSERHNCASGFCLSFWFSSFSSFFLFSFLRFSFFVLRKKVCRNLLTWVVVS